MTMQQLGNLLGKYQGKGVGAAVSRAAVIDEANRWLAGRHPKAADRGRASAIVGGRIVFSCVGSAVANEIRLLEGDLLAALRGRFPGYRLDGLKCLVRGSKVADEDER